MAVKCTGFNVSEMGRETLAEVRWMLKAEVVFEVWLLISVADLSYKHVPLIPDRPTGS